MKNLLISVCSSNFNYIYNYCYKCILKLNIIINICDVFILTYRDIKSQVEDIEHRLKNEDLNIQDVGIFPDITPEVSPGIRERIKRYSKEQILMIKVRIIFNLKDTKENVPSCFYNYSDFLYFRYRNILNLKPKYASITL